MLYVKTVILLCYNCYMLYVISVCYREFTRVACYFYLFVYVQLFNVTKDDDDNDTLLSWLSDSLAMHLQMPAQKDALISDKEWKWKTRTCYVQLES